MRTIKHLGFTLLEMLLTLTLVAILSALGTVAYTQVINRAHRLLAEQTLMAAAATLERYALTHGSYEGADLPLPENTNLGYHYNANIHPTTYTLTAEPNANNHDHCGRLSVTEMHNLTSESDNSSSLAP